MIPGEVIALYSLLGVLLGGLLSVHVQLSLRKERDKEVVYKERIAAYKEIAECFWKIRILYAAVFNDKNKCKEVREEFLRLNDAIDQNILFVSDVIRKQLVKFRAEVTVGVLKIVQDDLGLKELIKSNPGDRLVEERCRAMINEMRRELGVDVLSKDMLESFKS